MVVVGCGGMMPTVGGNLEESFCSVGGGVLASWRQTGDMPPYCLQPAHKTHPPTSRCFYKPVPGESVGWHILGVNQITLIFQLNDVTNYACQKGQTIWHQCKIQRLHEPSEAEDKELEAGMQHINNQKVCILKEKPSCNPSEWTLTSPFR